MSLDKEARESLKTKPFQLIGIDRFYGWQTVVNTVTEVSTQQNEKLSTELEQTKEKLKRCEEFLRDISLNHALVYRIDDVLSQLKDNG